jgi:hypothetical protein
VELHHFIVVPDNDNLLQTLSGNSLVVKTEKISAIDSIIEKSKLFDFHIHAIWVKSRTSLSNITFNEHWKDTPIALHVNNIGIFHHFLMQMPLMRMLNLRIYMPLDEKQQFTDIRILSSLGLETAAIIPDENPDWESLNDLMVYALLNIRTHGNIAPFNYLAEKFDVHARNDYSSVYFDQPQQYLHVDEQGHIALTNTALIGGNFVSEQLSDLVNIEEHEDYKKYLHAWTEYFIQTTECSNCEGWRVCLGKFSKNLTINKGCKSFFTDFLNTLEKNRLIKEKKKNLKLVWQP